MRSTASVGEILFVVGRLFGVSREDLLRKGGNAPRVTIAAGAASVLIREFTNMSYQQIADAMHRTSHTSPRGLEKSWHSRYRFIGDNEKRLNDARLELARLVGTTDRATM